MSLEEMWTRLAQHQPFADERGYGEAWAAMCEERTEAAARAAAAATIRLTGAPEQAAQAAAAVLGNLAEAKAAAADALYWVEKAEDKE